MAWRFSSTTLESLMALYSLSTIFDSFHLLMSMSAGKPKNTLLSSRTAATVSLMPDPTPSLLMAAHIFVSGLRDTAHNILGLSLIVVFDHSGNKIRPVRQ